MGMNYRIHTLKVQLYKMTLHGANISLNFVVLGLLQQVMWQVDSILFCLLVLHALCDSQGRIWRAHPCHLYALEVTLPKVLVATC